jgi:outer membrane protein insertion porin family
MAFSRKLCLVLLALWGMSIPLHAEKIAEIRVSGQQSLSEKQVLAVIRSREGDDVDAAVVNEDIKRIWRMGLFIDVRVLVEPSQGKSGVVLTFQVKERAVVKEIRYFGNKEVSDGTIKDKVTIKEGDTYEPGKVAESVKAVEAMYKDKDYYAIEISTDTKPATEAGKVILNFRINEGIRMKIQKIIITGNKVFSASKIKDAMKDTEEEGWITGGSYDPDKVAADLESVLKLYVSNGYAKAKLEGYTLDEFGDHSKDVVRKITEFNEAGREIVLRFNIEEGQQYKYTGMTLKGMQVFTEKELRARVETADGDVFNREKWDNDMQKLRQYYASKGYIYAAVTPNYEWDDQKGQVRVDLDVSEGSKAYVEEIKIRGNDITKDKVIRRMIMIKPGDAFDSETISKSRMAVYNLGYFENVGVDTQPGSEMDKLVLIFDVSPERKTGTLSVGAGYSSVEGLVGFLQVSQNNLFGNGQSVSAQWNFGTLTNSYSLSFTEPWLFDVPLSLTSDLYKRTVTQAYNSQGFDQTSVGGSLRLGYTLNEYWKVFGTYRYQSDDTTNILPTLTGIASGIINVSSITPSLTRDTRDNIFDATRGTYNTISLTLAGGYLGGDASFYEPVYDTRWFFQTPAIFGQSWMNMFVLSMHGRVGYAIPYAANFDSNPDANQVPVSMRFFVGGTDTVRGYQDRSLGASEIGGGQLEALTNVEYGFHPVPPLKLHVFYDSGNTWSDSTPLDPNNPGGAKFGWTDNGRSEADFSKPFLDSAVGVGMLFTIPTSVIQLRLDWGFGLDHDSPGYSPGGKVHFNIGNIF